MINDLAAQLTLPGLPEWSGLVVLGGLLLVALAYLVMPFSVFGVKGRLGPVILHRRAAAAAGLGHAQRQGADLGLDLVELRLD